jgi:hypothetical protein
MQAVDSDLINTSERFLRFITGGHWPRAHRFHLRIPANRNAS